MNAFLLCLVAVSGFVQLNSATEEDVCLLPQEVGPCRGSIEQYYYNDEEDDCLLFYYGGCNGNGNRFNTEKQCLKQCRTGVYLQQRLRNLAEKIIKAVNSSSVCHLPQDSGPCEALIPRYYFNQTSDECEIFNYGGCEGNENNFESLSNCEETCKPSVEKISNLLRTRLWSFSEDPLIVRLFSEQNSICTLPPVAGMCLALFQRFFYNASSERCEEFIYGGCQGNENNFQTEQDCLSSCFPPDKSFVLSELISLLKEEINNQIGLPEFCLLASDPGPCFGYFQRYFYNNASKRCETFIYGNCGGNGNNFRDEDECNKNCPSTGPYYEFVDGVFAI